MNPEQSTIAIRTTTSDDEACVARVLEAAFAPLRSVYRPTEEAIARQAEYAREGTRLVAEIDGLVVGTLRFTVHEHHVHLMGLAVHPNYQRRGIARRMIEWVADHAPNLERTTLALSTIKETGTVPLYERLGFRAVREEAAQWCESDVYADLHDVTMERRLR